MCPLATNLDISFGKDNLLKGESRDFKDERDFRGLRNEVPKAFQELAKVTDNSKAKGVAAPRLALKPLDFQSTVLSTIPCPFQGAGFSPLPCACEQ